MKKYFKNRPTAIWSIASIAVLTLGLAVNICAYGPLNQLGRAVFGNEETVGRNNKDVYFQSDVKTKEEARNQGYEVTKKITSEGFTLLKNKDNVLPLKENRRKVSVFGKNSVNLVYGGSGSGAGYTENAKTIFDSLEEAGFSVNSTLKEFYKDNSKSGKGRDSNPAMENPGVSSLDTGETPIEKYPESVTNSYTEYKDLALIVLSRISGEGFDLPRYSSSTHYLQLTDNERSLIQFVEKQGFTNIVVALNCNNIREVGELEKDDAISAIIHVPGPGYTGIRPFGKILTGEINPSGHTVDTWAKDFSKDPTWNNFGNNIQNANGSTLAGNEYTSDGNKTGYYYADYEENIYVGYRYYETRYATETDKEDWYQDNVVYPFGYGLSYSSFRWSVVHNELSGQRLTDSDKNKDYSITVKVENTSDKYSGKDVVELYVTPSYSTGGIEKSHVVLAGFAKTSLLAPGQSEELTIKVNPYSFASYDDSDANGNDFKGYELDGGDYHFSLRSDAHRIKDNLRFDFSVTNDGIRYQNDATTGEKVENLFDDADDQLDRKLSRSDWEGSWPTMDINHPFDDEYVNKAKLSSTTVNNPNSYTERPLTGQDNGLELIDRRGVDYSDKEKWGKFLDQLTFEERKDLFNRGAFSTTAISRVGKPATLDSDGPVGFVNFRSESDIYGTCSYCCEVARASTWNVELIQERGECVGEEGIVGKVGLAGSTPYSGWYAPGRNLHRSPFGGRNYEYFSEDPILTGKRASAEIKGTKSKGLYTMRKHFALNEQETNRDSNGLVTWATEQSIRELYLKPFERAVKEADAPGVRSSFNRIGTKWTGGDYRLLTHVLRNEWGFKGAVICDFNVSGYRNAKQRAYAGGDLNLTTTRPWTRADSNNANDVSILRNAAFHTLYRTANSNCRNGIVHGTKLSTVVVWEKALRRIDLGIGAVILVSGVAINIMYFRKKKPGAEKEVKQ